MRVLLPGFAPPWFPWDPPSSTLPTVSCPTHTKKIKSRVGVIKVTGVESWPRTVVPHTVPLFQPDGQKLLSSVEKMVDRERRAEGGVVGSREDAPLSADDGEVLS